jgi:hypothetical protein
LLSSVGDQLWQGVWERVGRPVLEDVTPVGESVDGVLVDAAVGAVWDRVMFDSPLERVQEGAVDTLWDSVWESVRRSVPESVRAYTVAHELVHYRFFDEYLSPNELQALAHFNELVSGYWLGAGEAIVVRRPRLLVRDAAGRLHSARGKCIEYRNGWGFHAWHGVRVPDRVILAPAALTREDFLREKDVEVRRVIQERMGGRFVSAFGGQVVDSGPRGTLYEVALPKDDPERVARYVQVRDTATARQYFLRVPPTIQTAEEAVAWTFQLSVEDYHPEHES